MWMKFLAQRSLLLGNEIGQDFSFEPKHIRKEKKNPNQVNKVENKTTKMIKYIRNKCNVEYTTRTNSALGGRGFN